MISVFINKNKLRNLKDYKIYNYIIREKYLNLFYKSLVRLKIIKLKYNISKDIIIFKNTPKSGDIIKIQYIKK